MPIIARAFYLDPRNPKKDAIIKRNGSVLFRAAFWDYPTVINSPHVEIDWGAPVKDNKRLYVVSLKYEYGGEK